MNDPNASRPRDPELDAFLAPFPLAEYLPGDVLVANTYLQPSRSRVPRVGYVRKGLVRGAWYRPAIAPEHQFTVGVAGDGDWIGLDSFKYGENLFRYTSLTATTAWVFPLSALQESAPRSVLLDALRSMSLAWCTAVSVVSLKGQGLDRRAMLLLYNLSRIHPRPDLRITQKVVAELVGVSRQALSPILKRLEQKGLVRLGYGKVAVEDPVRIIEELRRTAADRPDAEDATSPPFWAADD